MDFANRLRNARKTKGWTQEQLQQFSGVSQATISKIERGDQLESVHTPRLAAALGVSAVWLAIGGQSQILDTPSTSSHWPTTDEHSQHAVRETGSGYTVSTAHKPHLVPLISWVQAGHWCEAATPYADAESYEPCPFDHSEQAFYLRVVGDSMYPEYLEGALILIDPAIEAQHGDDVIVRTPEGQVTFKRLQITPDGTYLLALNPDWQPRRINIPAETHICGVITGTWTNKRRRK